MATKKKRPKKQTSDRVSRTAACIIDKLEGMRPEDHVRLSDWITVRDVRSVCMSVLSQDEVKGRRKP